MDLLAKWIWAESLRDTANCYLYARKEFEVAAAPSAEAWVTCSSEYKLYVNGRYVGRGPGPCPPKSRYYDTFDLSHAIRPGKNVIAAICHSDGPDPGGFILQLTIHRNGDKEQVIATDDSWRVLPATDWDFTSSRMAPNLGFQEVYDSRKKPVGWNVVGFDDSAWQQADVLEEPHAVFVPRQIPPLKEWDIHPQQALDYDASAIRYAKEMLIPSGEVAIVNPGRDSSIVLDFGMEVVGYPGLRIRGGGSATIDLMYGEALDGDGHVPPSSQGVRQSDTLILHGGRQEWQSFGRRTFRYVQLTLRNLDAQVAIESLYLTRIGYPVEQVSTFECSDDRLNAIWRDGVYALSLCMQNDYEPCPLTNPTPSPVAARAQALANYYSFFDHALAAKALHRFAKSPDSDPMWVTMLHDYYLHTADLGLVTQLYPQVRSRIDDGESVGYSILRDAEKLARAMSNSEDALRWHDRACESFEPRSDFDALRNFAELGKTIEALDMLRAGVKPLWVPTWFLPAEVLGVKPSLPGAGVVIQPRVGDLAWAKGTIKTIAGFANVEWHREEGLLRIDIEAPAGFMVAVPVGDFTNPVIDEIDLTPETPERRARQTYGWGHTVWRDGEEHDPYLDWLATQESQPPAQYQRRQRLSGDQSYIWIRESVSIHVRYEVREG